MANNINLVSGKGITCTLNQSNGTLTIQVKDSDLSSINTIKNILDRLEAVEKAITIDSQFINASPKPATVTDTLARNWVENIVSDVAAASSHTHTLANITDLQINSNDHDNSKKVHIKY